MADRDFEIKTYDDINNDFVTELTAQQANLPAGKKALTDFSVGSMISTILRSIASVLSSYWSFVKDITDGFYTTTATGDRLKRRFQDFGFEMHLGYPASGKVCVVQTAGGSFARSVNIGDTLYSGSWGYTVTAGCQSFTPNSSSNQLQFVTVTANQNGAGGNLGAGVVLTPGDSSYQGLTFTVGSSMNSTQTVVTSGGLTGGSDDESEANARLRFVDYIQNLGKGTTGVIEAAVKGVAGVKSVHCYDNSVISGGLIDGPEQDVTHVYPGNCVLLVLPDQVDNTTTSGLPPALETAIRAVVDSSKAAGMAYAIKTFNTLQVDVAVKLRSPLTVPSTDWDAYTAKLTTLIHSTFNGLTVNQSLNVLGLQAQLTALDITKASGGLQVICTARDVNLQPITIGTAGYYTMAGGLELSVVPQTAGNGQILVCGQLTFSNDLGV